MRKTIIIIALLGLFLADIYGQNCILKENISYISSDEKDEYRRERCKLDIYYPEGKTNYPTKEVLW